MPASKCFSTHRSHLESAGRLSPQPQDISPTIPAQRRLRPKIDPLEHQFLGHLCGLPNSFLSRCSDTSSWSLTFIFWICKSDSPSFGSCMINNLYSDCSVIFVRRLSGQFRVPGWDQAYRSALESFLGRPGPSVPRYQVPTQDSLPPRTG